MAGLSVPYAFLYQVITFKAQFDEGNGTLDDFMRRKKDNIVMLLNRYSIDLHLYFEGLISLSIQDGGAYLP